MNIFKNILLCTALLSISIIGCEKDASSKGTKENSSLKIIKAAPVFTAQNFDGKVFKSEDLKGKVWVGSLFFTNCQGPCPMLTSRLSVLKSKIETSEDIAFVSMSVDPENDTIAALKNYAERYGATEGGKWYFVRMPKDSLERVVRKGFLLAGDDQPEVHSTHFFLVDRQGQIRGYYDGSDEKRIGELENDIRSLLKTKE